MNPEYTDEFMGAVSPQCIIHDCEQVGRPPTLEETKHAVRQVVTNYARNQGLPEATEWATLRATNALDAGESAHRAIRAGEQAVDEWPLFFRCHTPITTPWKAAQEMGLTDIRCTATGVAGRKRYRSVWLRVGLELEDV